MRHCAIAAALAATLGGCAGSAGLPPAQSSEPIQNAISNTNVSRLVWPDAVPPKCKGQKNTKQYASVDGQHVTTQGVSVCVPAFGGWGGSLQFPAANAPTSLSLISSTTAYEPGLFPPPGSKAPVFYLQFAFGMDLTFGSKLPAGNGIASAKIVPKRAYTVSATLNFGSLWENVNSCYTVAKKSQYGGSIGRVGGVFLGHGLNHSTGVIEIFSGKLVTNAC